MKILIIATDLGATSVLGPIGLALRQKDVEVKAFAPSGERAVYGFEAHFGERPNELSPLNTLTEEKMKVLFQEEKPSAVAVGISSADNSVDRLALQAAIAMGIPCFVAWETWPGRDVDVYTKRGDFALYKGASGHFVPDEISMEMMARMGVDKGKVFPLGNPAWEEIAKVGADLTKHHAALRKELELPEDGIVLMWAGTLNLDAEDYPEHREFLGTLERDVLEAFLSATDEVGLPVIVRQKPGFGTEVIKEIIGRHSGHIVFSDQKFSAGAGTFPVPVADAVFGMATLVLHNAALLGIPAISCIPNPIKPGLWFASEVGMNIGLDSLEEMKAMIRKIASTGAEELSKFKGMLKLPVLIPGAADRIASQIISMA